MVTGLRGRLVLALMLIALVTIGVTAFTLLSPLQARLRQDRTDALTVAVRGARQTLAELGLPALRADDPRVRAELRDLRRRTGADIAILDRTGHTLASTDHDVPGGYPGGVDALEEHALIKTDSNGPEGTFVAVAVPVDRGAALVARGRIGNAARVVRGAFVPAAAVSLLVALIFGLLLSERLARRLRALRDTALQVADGNVAQEVRPERHRDEVGDLTRAFATMQRRLHEQEVVRRAFVSTASHELRTPLSSLQLRLDMLRDDLEQTPPDTTRALEQTGQVEAQVDRLAALTADLLDLSRLDAGVPLRSEDVAVEEVTRSVAAEFELRAQRAGRAIRLGADDPSNPHWAHGDPGAAAQIVRILLDNALRHAPPGSAVHIDVTRDGRAVAVTVADEGDGVPPEERERIFERFHRGPGAEGAPGFGLGLPIGRELARRMGGDLRVDGDAAGGRFTLRIPASAAPVVNGSTPDSLVRG